MHHTVQQSVSVKVSIVPTISLSQEAERKQENRNFAHC